MDRIDGMFEGWYFKHQCGDEVLSLIVGCSSGSDGDHAFIQVITKELARYIPFPIEDYYADKDTVFIRIGANYFSKKGIIIDLHERGLCLTGQIDYGEMHPISGDIMGLFAHIPKMECYHGIVSTHHSLRGAVTLNDKLIDFDGGRGYIESDMGRSFPERYLWLHCNSFIPHDICVTAAVATIPLGSVKFTGCIIHLRFNGKEHTFATYNGVRIIRNGKGMLIVSQGDYRLELEYSCGRFGELSAPSGGNMNRRIKECVAGEIALRLFDNGKLVVSAAGTNAGIEIVRPDPKPNRYAKAMDERRRIKSV